MIQREHLDDVTRMHRIAHLLLTVENPEAILADMDLTPEMHQAAEVFLQAHASGNPPVSECFWSSYTCGPPP